MTMLTIGIATRDRPDALRRCLRSIASELGEAHEVLVFDDASKTPAADVVAEACSSSMPVRVLRDDRGVGPIAGRNQLVSQAANEIVFLLDDDAAVIDPAAVERAVSVLERDRRIAAVAFAQAEADGRPWPESMQPGRATVPAEVPAYIGFAHLLRRSTFLSVGGYRAELVYYGEEKELCIRLLEAGYAVVYLPDALVAHIPDPAGRDPRRYVRQVIRNDCLMSLYNEPWPVVAISLPLRMWRYRKMIRQIAPRHSASIGWLARELRAAWPAIRVNRRPVSWTTIRAWRRLSRSVVPYEGGSGG